MKMIKRIATCWLVLALPAFTQSPTTPAVAPAIESQGASDTVQSYEIVSIKPHKAESGSSPSGSLPDGSEWHDMPLFSLVSGAYGIIMDDQISGLPGWAKQESYDILVKVDAETAERWKKLSKKEREKEEQPMMRSLLADRCHFKAHEETKELPVYNLVIAKGGLKMKDAPSNEPPMASLSSGQMTLLAMGMDTIVAAFSSTEGRIIVDKTGLGDKKFDFELKWTPNEQPTADDAPPTFLTALEEQLGLKLVSAKGPVKVLTVDHMDRPSPD